MLTTVQLPRFRPLARSIRVRPASPFSMSQRTCSPESYAAAHVVADPFNDTPMGEPAIDWDATMAFPAICGAWASESPRRWTRRSAAWAWTGRRRRNRFAARSARLGPKAAISPQGRHGPRRSACREGPRRRHPRLRGAGRLHRKGRRARHPDGEPGPRPRRLGRTTTPWSTHASSSRPARPSSCTGSATCSTRRWPATGATRTSTTRRKRS